MEMKIAREQTAPVWFYSLAVLITQLDGGAVSTLLSSIMHQYQLTPTAVSWVSGLYTLGLVIATPVVANWADLFGERRVFLSELALWFVGALVTFIAPSYSLVLVGRLLQAAGDCGIIVMSIDAMIAAARRNHQGRKVSLMGIMSGLAALLAPIIAGITLGTTGDWHNFYGLMLPLLAVLFLLGWKVLPHESGQPQYSADWLGALVFSAGLAAWMLALMFAQHLLNYLVLVVSLVIIGIIFFALFIRIEHRLPTTRLPFLPLKLLRQYSYRQTILLGTIGGMFFALFVYIPTYLSASFGLSAQAAGMMLTAPGLGSLLGAFLGGLLVDRAGNRLTMVSATSLLALSTLGIALTITNLRAFLGLAFLMGIGIGALMSAPLQVIAGRLAGRNNRAQAIGGLSAGKKIGLTIAPLLFATSMDLLSKGHQLSTASFQSIFFIAAALAVICLIIAAVMPLGEINHE